MSSCLILSRYNENINWVSDLNFDKKLIYNKGINLIENNKYEIINLKNVGRESQTWLYYIVNNYHNLYENNVFLQGRIDDLGCMAYKKPDDYIEGIKKYGFSASRLGLLGPLHWSHNVGIEKDIRYKDAWDNGEISRSKLGFRKFAKFILPGIPIIVPTSYGGCFGVSKRKILQWELGFYENLLEILSKHKNPIEGHYMERLWCYIFTKNELIFNAFHDVIKTKLERN